MQNGKTRGPTLLGGVLLLTVANLAVKVIGLIFKIPLSHLLGDEGMGYFNTAYTIYSWLYIISTAGLPVAVSIMISGAAEQEDRRAVDRIFRIAMAILLTVGLIGCFLMILLATPLSRLLGSEVSRSAIIAVAPTLLFISVVGGLRGYFQGCKRMLPTAVSQLIEALGKLILGLLFGGYAASRGASLGEIAAAAILGVTVGTALGALYLIGLRLAERRKTPSCGKASYVSGDRRILRSMLALALPITLSSAVTSLTNLIDLGFIMNRLTSLGMAEAEATALFGNYTTLVVPMSHLPSVFIYPIAASLVPYLSSELASGRRERAARLSESALRFASVITLPAMLGFALFGGRLLSIFFRAESAALAAPTLAVLAPSVFFLGLTTVTNAILEANGRAGATLRSMLLGALVKGVIGYFLIGDSRFGIYGAAIGTVACYALTATLNLFTIGGIVGRLPSFYNFFFKPLAATAGAVLPTLLLSRFFGFNGTLGTCLLMFIAGAVYLSLLLILRVLEPEELQKMPIIGHFTVRKRRFRQND